MSRMHPVDGSRCRPETCGGVSYDPCNYEMPRTVYVVGGAGSGKSTFMAALMDLAVMQYGPLEDFHSLRNTKALVTLRGHRVHSYEGRDGLYIGCLRDSFPGTDGLDRASSPVGEAWLDEAGQAGLGFIIGEGATLATRRFLYALHRHTELLLVHLHVDDETRAARFAERGSSQDSRFVQNTVTRSLNLWAELQKAGVTTLDVDTADSDAWELGVDIAATWVR